MAELTGINIAITVASVVEPEPEPPQAGTQAVQVAAFRVADRQEAESLRAFVEDVLAGGGQIILTYPGKLPDGGGDVLFVLYTSLAPAVQTATPTSTSIPTLVQHQAPYWEPLTSPPSVGGEYKS